MRDRDRFKRVDHAYRAARFYEKIGYERPSSPGGSSVVVESITKMLAEEVAETAEAAEALDLHGAVDGLADVAFVAIGGLWKLGLDPDAVIAEVCRSNLTKTAGSTDRLDRDAVKGDGYVPPAWCDGTPLDAFAGSPVRVPKVLIEAARLRQSKAQDYMSAGVRREDYNPFGIESYAHNVIEKAMRVKSLVKSGTDPNHESLRDTLVDLINFASFMVEHIDDDEVDV